MKSADYDRNAQPWLSHCHMLAALQSLIDDPAALLAERGGEMGGHAVERAWAVLQVLPRHPRRVQVRLRVEPPLRASVMPWEGL